MCSLEREAKATQSREAERERGHENAMQEARTTEKARDMKCSGEQLLQNNLKILKELEFFNNIGRCC